MKNNLRKVLFLTGFACAAIVATAASIQKGKKENQCIRTH